MAFYPIQSPRRTGALLLLCGLLGGAALPARAADVGVSIAIHQPGVYGRIDIGRFRQPQLIVQQPVMVYRQARAAEPVYGWVPPGHRQHWRQHCRGYNACGTPVYFVQERWHQDHVVRAAPQRGNRHGLGDDWRVDRRDDHHDSRHDSRHDGAGHGRGHGRD